MIAIGGMDRAGKSLQRRVLLEYLADRGCDPIYVWTRFGYTPRLESAKRLLRRLRPSRRRSAAGQSRPRYPRRAATLGRPWQRWLWTTLALLDLLYVYAVEVPRLHARGHAVVCDRGPLDALVDLRVNFPDDRIEERWLWRLLLGFSVRSDATFLLLIGPDESLRRARLSGRRSIESPEVMAARLGEYRRLAASGAGVAIDATAAPEQVARAVRERVAGLLDGSPLRTGLAA